MKTPFPLSPAITDINSNSSIGVSRVVVTFDANTDKNSDANQVATVVSTAIRNLPAGINPPTIQTFDPNSAPILQFGVSGGGVNLADVNDYVQNTLAPNLQRVDGVANVGVDGAPAKEFQVLLNPNRLRYYNLSPQQVVSAITSSALNMPIGTIVKDKSALTFSTQNTPADMGAIGRTLVDSSRGISVSDVGVVRSMPAAVNFVRVNGAPQLLVSIQRTTDSNAVAVADSVRAMLKRTPLPPGYVLTYSNDTTGPIKASVAATYHELFLTALVVAIIVLLFLGKLNTAFGVILAIPIALSAAPFLLAGRVHAQPRVHARHHHRHRHRGGRLDCRGGKRGAISCHGLRPEGLRPSGGQRSLQCRRGGLAVAALRPAAGELHRRLCREVPPAVLPGACRRGGLLPAGSGPVPDRPPGVHAGFEKRGRLPQGDIVAAGLRPVGLLGLENPSGCSWESSASWCS